MANSLVPDQAQHFVGPARDQNCLQKYVGPDLDQNCSQRLPADDKGKLRVKI